MHNVELMTSLIVASTALAGLQAIVVNQIVQSKLVNPVVKVLFRVSAVLTFVLAIVTVWGATNWLTNEIKTFLSVAQWGFGLQLLTFTFVVGGLTAQISEK